MYCKYLQQKYKKKKRIKDNHVIFEGLLMSLISPPSLTGTNFAHFGFFSFILSSSLWIWLFFSKETNDSGKGVTVWGQLDVSDAVGGPWCRHRENFCGPHSSKDRCFPGESIRPCRPQESGLLIDNWLAEACLGPSGCQVDLGALKWKPSVPAQNQVLYQPVPNRRSLEEERAVQGWSEDRQFSEGFPARGLWGVRSGKPGLLRISV